MKVNRVIAFVLALSIVFNLSGGSFFLKVHGVGLEKVEVVAYEFTDKVTIGDLKIQVKPNNHVPVYNNIRLSYHIPEAPTIYQIMNIPITPDKLRINQYYDILNLKKDYIYDFYVEFLDVANATVAEGFLYYTPRMTFEVGQVEQIRKPLVNGGFESGDVPRIKVGWTVPKIWVAEDGDFDGTFESGAFVELGSAAMATRKGTLDTIVANMEKDFKTGNESITSFRYKISISQSQNFSFAEQDAILVEEEGGGEYRARVYNGIVPSSDFAVARVGASPFEFDILGKLEDEAAVAKTGTAEEIAGFASKMARFAAGELPAANVIPHPKIYPGNLYYMGVNLTFQNALSQDLVIVKSGGVGLEKDISLVYGTKFTYTPLRFQLSKDDYNNVNVLVLEMNSGGINVANLVYEVKISSVKDFDEDNLAPQRTIVQSDFINGQALQMISGVGNNLNYYKIFVKGVYENNTGAGETIIMESCLLNYSLSEDVSKLPVPIGVYISDLQSSTGTIDGDYKNSSDVTVIWQKPSVWKAAQSTLDPTKDLVYHFMLNVNQADAVTVPKPMLASEDDEHGQYDSIYRKYKHVASSDPAIKDNGDTLEYTIKGFEIFTNNSRLEDPGGGYELTTTSAISVEQGYPKFLLPNKTYFLQMYVTNSIRYNTTDRLEMSDKSYTVSFTTKSSAQVNVPAPKGFVIRNNDIDTSTSPAINFIDLNFEKVSVNWDYIAPDLIDNDVIDKKVYYDLYMSKTPYTTDFVKICTDQPPIVNAVFTEEQLAGSNGSLKPNIVVNISKFDIGTPAHDEFGPKLLPNTSYYFKILTRLFIAGRADLSSSFTNVLSATTLRLQDIEQDETNKKPLAPVEFAIAKDSKGNLLLKDVSVAFDWTNKETNVEYEITATSYFVKPTEDETKVYEDYIYKSYKETLGNIVLNPNLLPLPQNLVWSDDETLKYSFDKWIQPNSLYYFSIRSIRIDKITEKSNWICIPVTTLLIEAPEGLDIISRPEICFNWEDTATVSDISKYTILLKKSTDSENDYTEVKFSNLSINKKIKNYYIRVLNLESDTTYDVKIVNQGTGEEATAITGLKTRDDYHEVEVRWVGYKNFKYSVTAKYANNSEYSEVADTSMEDIYDRDGNNVFYLEETDELSSVDKAWFYARIFKLPLISGDSASIDTIKSNSKVNVKVRAYKIDPLNSLNVSWSKYLGPINIRTAFYQVDSDQDTLLNKLKDDFRLGVKKIQDDIYWRMNIDSTSINKLLLKGDRVANMIKNTDERALTIDVSQIQELANVDVVYIPSTIIGEVNDKEKILTIRTKKASFGINPGTIALNVQSDIVDVFYRLEISRTNKPSVKLPQKISAISTNNKIALKAVETTKKDSELKDLINNKLNNSSVGLIAVKLGAIDAKSDVDTDDVNTMVLDTKRELASFVNSKLTVGTNDTIVGIEKDVINFKNPLRVGVEFSENSRQKSPYIYYAKGKEWIKVKEDTQLERGLLKFNMYGTGQMLICVEQIASTDNSVGGTTAEKNADIVAKYNIYDLLKDGKDTDLAEPMSMKETVSLIDRIINGNKNEGKSYSQKISGNGLGELSTSDSRLGIKKKQFALIIVKLYAAKTGTDINRLNAARDIYFADKEEIDTSYYKYCILSIEIGALNLSNIGEFEPEKDFTYNEVFASIQSALKKAGIE